MSKKTALQAVQSQLRAVPPQALSALSREEIEDLADALREARRRQAAELSQAGERAYGHIPWLLRGPIRRVMGG